MHLSPEIFAIDSAVVVSRLEAFIRDSMHSFSRAGILVPLSGGLDSSTVAALCARAVGRENVTGLMLPDIKGAPDALRFGRLVARNLGIRTHTINMTRVLMAVGAYRFAANLVPSRRLLASIVRRHMARAGRSLFLDAIRGSDDAMVRKAFASIYARQRARVVNVLPDESGVPIEPGNLAYRSVKLRPRSGRHVLFIRTPSAWLLLCAPN